MISRENYEIYVMDYLDGQLSVEDEKALLLFLDANPDLKEEVETLSGFKLTPPSDLYYNKANLKQVPDLPEVNLNNLDDFLLHKIENNLNNDEQKKLQDFLDRHPEKLQDECLLKACVLKPNEDHRVDKLPLIVYPNGNFEETCIAFLEGDLSIDASKEFIQFVDEHPGAKMVMNSFKQSILAKEHILYPYKNELKKTSTPVLPIFWRVAGMAAAIATIAWFVWPSNKFDQQNSYQARKSSSFESNLAIFVDDWELPSSLQSNEGTKLLDESEEKDSNDGSLMHFTSGTSEKTERKNIDPKNLGSSNDHIAQSVDLIQPRKAHQVVVKPHPYQLTKDSMTIPPLELSNENNVASNVSPVELSQPSELSFKQAVAKTISNKIMDEPSEYDTDLNYATINSIGKLTNSDVEYEKQNNQKRSTTAFSIGKFSFYRSKKAK